MPLQLQLSPEKIKSAIATLITQADVLHKEMNELNKKLDENTSTISALFKVYESITGKRPVIDPQFVESIRTGTMTNMKLGDAVYTILKTACHALTKDEIINKLRDGNAKLSIKHPKVVLNTMLKNDAGKYFKILKDGKIDLVKR